MEELTKSMGKLGSDSQKEAIAMRIITVVTLIFLPATFVSVSSQPPMFFYIC
jgi:Mg2+ and Co2+ transporter CorA